ncbi:nucleotide exchange factor GrpE [Pseudoflavonifractor sp. DSM 107456]|uniref:Protein GrpE n=2 Tax=Pseudoflavonifractor TaxID=1017280 RepID=A0ABR9RA62_9FIRM|nr:MULTISPECIES: nucleotide exchange factor GrpE [Eubacteriales]MBC5730363.1 nucleotide exchange factor GrpE [Pseudoflavonifractor hominis]MBE5055584.1 nucleotide exchange factor GrpE [Pseudoflavonifractor gallinarum]MBT9684006.1 nucleotide exchange factor GrpE [Pseudoflavonifractor sp. MCC625]
MSKKENEQAVEQAEQMEPETVTEEVTEGAAPETDTPDPLLSELEALKDTLAQKEDQYLRLAAEYDNYRRRSQKEKTDAYQSAKSDAVLAFLPVYDNLERALKQETADEAYKKGVEMTMNGLKEVLSKLGVEEIPALGQTFDPNLHNAVMHVEDENAGENTVVEVFQAGFQSGDKVIRFAMVKVAN